MTVQLFAGEWHAEVRPEIGGVLSALRFNGVDVLRPMPADATDPLQSASFALVPYCNRIADGTFRWCEQMIEMPRNFPPEQHSLHGLGWQVPWEVARADSFRCTLVHRHSGSDASWPWAYRAEQRIRLGAQGCKVTLDVTNFADTPMPTGLGFHPYFRRNPETRLRFASEGMMVVDAGLIPTGERVPSKTLADWGAGTALPEVLVDHCFVHWAGKVRIEDALGTITLSARGAPNLHVYSPTDDSALCCEPVTHTPDAPNQSPGEMIVLPPGCTASVEMEISAMAA
ncbi:MAG: aldose 1-epimerase [Erythrobacter sp.]|nr:MAG: aldose 1-epimerase [Erythrobacter sp.]